MSIFRFSTEMLLCLISRPDHSPTKPRTVGPECPGLVWGAGGFIILSPPSVKEVGKSVGWPI